MSEKGKLLNMKVGEPTGILRCTNKITVEKDGVEIEQDCGGTVFACNLSSFGVVSVLQSRSGKQELVPQPLIQCIRCGAISRI